MKGHICRGILILFLLVPQFLSLPSAYALPGDYLFYWGAKYHIGSDGGIATDSNGTVYIADGFNHRVQVFTSTGERLRTFGSYGSGDGQFWDAAAVALDGQGNIYVADYFNRRIEVFNNSGTFLRQVGNGDISYPYGVAVDDGGNVYVADSDNNRIQVFAVTGKLVRSIGSDQLSYPSSVMVVGKKVYVTEWGDVKIFTTTGRLLQTIGSPGYGDGQFEDATGVAVDAAGNVYVADNQNFRIQVFNSAGTLLRIIGGFTNGPQSIALDENGLLYVVPYYAGRVEILTTGGEKVAEWRSGGSGDGEFLRPLGMAVDQKGNVYVADNGNARIQVFNSKGEFVTKWGGWGSENGQFQWPAGVAVDRTGNVYVADWQNMRVQVFTGTGEFLRSIGAGEIYPFGVALDDSGNVYVNDWANYRIAIYSNSGTFLRQIWSSGAVAVDTAGIVYVLGYDRVQKYDSAGALVGEFGSGQLQDPRSIAIDRSGNVYVADTGNNRISVFTTTGTLLGTLGSAGDEEGHFVQPQGVASDPFGGRLYVADTANNRIEAFTGYGPTHFAFAGPSVVSAGSPFTFRISALNDANAPTAGYSGTVHFGSSDGSAKLPQDSVVTGGTGDFLATLRTMGTQDITVTDRDVPSLSGVSNSIEVSAIRVADLTIVASHKSNFKRGQTGTYTITVTNNGKGASSGEVAVTDTLPAGLIPVTISGSGWACVGGTLTCTRRDSLPSELSYPPIAVKVSVSGDAPATVVNTATVSGGGELNTSNDTATDPTTVM
jgi:tripartite motif-containing protein 71